jgi:hypothetical protein
MNVESGTEAAQFLSGNSFFHCGQYDFLPAFAALEKGEECVSTLLV